MALRSSMRGLTASIRSLSTTVRLANTPSTASSSSTPAPENTSNSFADLHSIISETPNTSEIAAELNRPPPSVSVSGPSIVDPTATRGYTAHGLPPDTDPLLDLVTNLLMKHGRKAEAQSRVSRLLSLIQGATNQNPLPLLQRAVTLSSPSIRVVSSRARAKTVQTPLALTERQRTRQGIVWILKAAERGRKGGVPREARIAREVLAVLEGSSDVFKWLEEKHKVATANRSNLNTRR